MVDQDVEKILAEIRSQVMGATETVNASPVNGSHVSSTPVARGPAPSRNEYASLTVLARAWDRLPPLVSNRTGTSARLELWLKAKLKRALKWITWEQVNFNAATYHAFLEIVESLNEQHQKLISLQNELASESQTRQRDVEAQREELKTQRAELLSYREQIENQRTALAAVQTLLSELSVRFTQFEEEQQTAAETRFNELVKEFRERDERLLDEQRVCFKQLSLELTESQVLQDRTRRDFESRIANLETEPPAI